MTIAQIVATATGGLILALITGLITKNIVIAILFPVLLIGFLLMWRKIKEETPTKPKGVEKEKVGSVEEEGEVEDRGDQVQPPPQANNYQQPMPNQSQPPVSTNYPPRQSLR
jgi:hypothetical protein